MILETIWGSLFAAAAIACAVRSTHYEENIGESSLVRLRDSPILFIIFYMLSLVITSDYIVSPLSDTIFHMMPKTASFLDLFTTFFLVGLVILIGAMGLLFVGFSINVMARKYRQRRSA